MLYIYKIDRYDFNRNVLKNMSLILYFIIIYMQYIDYRGGCICYVQGSNSYRIWERAVSSLTGVWGHNAIQMQENRLLV